MTLSRGDIRESFQIESSRVQHGRRILKLRGIDSVSEVERRIGAELGIPEEELPPAGEGNFYTFQLKGCTVTTMLGELLGTVTDVLDSGGAPLLRVEGKLGEILIPFAWSYLHEIDQDQRRIQVDLPEGLLDINK